VKLTISGRGAAAAIIAVGMALSSVGSSASEPQASRSQQVARERLSGMATYLATLPGFEVTLVGSYDAVQESGQKIEFNEVRAVAVSRPDKLRVEQRRSDGVLDLVVFDGKTMTVFSGEAGVYAQAPQPSTAALPCNPGVINKNGVTYYRCGQTYYMQAYGSAGPIYMPVPPPG
jgi:hypothetical protein